jgi:hypothetical protein
VTRDAVVAPGALGRPLEAERAGAVPLAEQGAAEEAPQVERVSVPELRPVAAAVSAGAVPRPEAAAVWAGVVRQREAAEERDAAVLPRAAPGAAEVAQPSVGRPSGAAWAFHRDQAQD